MDWARWRANGTESTTQALVPNASGPGRNLALEILIPNAAIKNLIREDKAYQIYSAMQTGQSNTGMQTMNQSLIKYWRAGAISEEDAMVFAGNTTELRQMLRRGGV